jgi:ABC-type transport system involved in cytochrome c biogenesis permease subunit
MLSSAAQAETLNYAAFASLPIQHDGRIKPLQTFALTHLQQIAGTTHIDDQSAIEWLASVMFNPSEAIERPLFLLNDTDAQLMLELPPAQNHRYRFTDVVQAIGTHQALVASLLERPADQLSLGQRAVVKLYSDSGLFRQIMLSATLVLPDSNAPPPSQMKRLRLSPTASTFMDYYHALPMLQRDARRIMAHKFATKQPYTASEKQIVDAARNLTVALETSRDNTLLRVVPPQWSEDREWLAPWAVFHSGKGSPGTARVIDGWRAMAAAYRTQDAAQWSAASTTLRDHMLTTPSVRPAALKLEIAYYQRAPLAKATALYVIGLICSLCFISSPPSLQKPLRLAAIATISMAAVLHTLSIAIRVIILHRPPVATLYESLLFVGLIAVLFGLFLEYRLRNAVGLLVAALAGSILLLSSEGFGSGDTMSMLMAVLNTNFWLATHVLCITTGYGFALVAGIMAHGYLLAVCRNRSPDAARTLFRSAYGTALIALLFTSIGTILGGIWADQSWGRFWGWDPKENGALMICLWIIWLLHSRITGQMHERGFATGLVLLNIVVACSWLGVNLLATGLHSYGFTDKAALGLALFCAAEMGFAAIVYGILWRRQRARLL